MEFTIASKKLGKTLTFSKPGGSYIFVDLNGRPGTLGQQICSRGELMGSALYYEGEDEKRFERICRRWYRAFLKKLS